MKLNGTRKIINFSLPLTGIFFALTATNIAYSMELPNCSYVAGKIYAGIFGGLGSSTKIDITQYGTAFFRPEIGGPLAVDAFGKTNRRTAKQIGAQIGYQWAEIFPNPCGSQLSLAPAIELEGYYLGKSSFTAHEINNETTRLDEHDFQVTYPMKTGIFLTNAVLNFNFSNLCKFHPYLSAGIGAAVTSISDADALQVAPLEAGVNHYNSKPSDQESTFAAQTKVGVSFDLSRNVDVFVEYRWLCISGSGYVFGSTVYPDHAPTSSWQVRMDSQYYNMGTIGIRCII